MKVLVIYELIPEETKKTIVEMTQEEYSYFKQVNNIVINLSNVTDIQNEVMKVIEAAFSRSIERIKYCKTEKEKQYFSKWKDIQLLEDISGVDKFIWCGFYL